MIRPLFLIGNKRSGTSQLVRVLNLHPQVFVSHESDIAWILFQLHRDQPFRPHPWDSDRGMRVTLASSGHLLSREASPRENLLAVQMSVMENGSPWLPAQSKKELGWIGDKKPMQHTDPQLLGFLLRHFPDAHFIHIVRHPFDVVASSERFNRTADGDFWLGLSREEKLERWAFHEQQVVQLRESSSGRVHSLRYEDFCRDTERELADAFKFLQLNPDSDVLRNAALQTRSSARSGSAIRPSAQAISIASIYGYDVSRSAGAHRSSLRLKAWNPYQHFARKP